MKEFRGTNPYIYDGETQIEKQVRLSFEDKIKFLEQQVTELKQKNKQLDKALRSFVDPDPLAVGFMFYGEFNEVSILMTKCRGCGEPAFLAHDIRHRNNCIVGNALKVLEES